MASNLVSPTVEGCDYCSWILHRNKSTFDIEPLRKSSQIGYPWLPQLAETPTHSGLPPNTNNKMQSSNKQFSEALVIWPGRPRHPASDFAAADIRKLQPDPSLSFMMIAPLCQRLCSRLHFKAAARSFTS